MDALEKIEESIVAGSEGFFDDQPTRDDLHVTIRIAKDFHEFLVKFGDNPPAAESRYVMGTIRSGMDWFFGLAHDCAIINTPRSSWNFVPQERWDFSGFRRRFLSNFERLTGDTDIGVIDRLALLLALTHMELVFLAQHFPSSVIDLGIE